jgi:hypothetical protein
LSSYATANYGPCVRQDLVGGITVETPEKVLQGINKYVDIGVTHFILHFIGLDETTLRLFETKVIRNT